jgi:hypothetical protein
MNLIRVLPGKFKTRHNDPSSLATNEDLYCCFFPVTVAVARKLVQVVGRAPVPRQYRTLPSFKMYNENSRTGVKTWFIWNGKAPKATKVAALSEQEKKYAMEEIVGFPVLVERIERGWLPEHEV